MATPYANVNVANIIGGACQSFTVDATQLGGTNGGVDLERQMKFTGIQIDQIPGDVQELISGDDIIIKTVLSETTLENLKLAWNSSGTITTAAGPPATKTLGVGIESGLAAEHALVFVGPTPDQGAGYTTRTFTIHKAVSFATGQSFKYEKKAELMFPITFKLHPDLSQTAGEEYFTVEDQ